MRYRGKITNWKDERGFGFIAPTDGGKRIFVHMNSFSNRRRRPAENEVVTYEIGTDSQGRAIAIRAAFAEDRQTSTVPVVTVTLLTLALAALAFVAIAANSGRLPFALLWLYVGASGLAFAVYAADKTAARNNRWRTPESTLHLFALVGGWPGALAAQRMLHHKSRKASFQAGFWATVIVNCAALGWLLTPSGAEVLRSGIVPLVRSILAEAIR